MASGTTHEEDLWEQGSRPAVGGPKVSHNECSTSPSLTSHSRFFSNLVAVSESLGDLSGGMAHTFILGLGVLGSRIGFSSLLFFGILICFLWLKQNTQGWIFHKERVFT